eukprot:2731977-Rhodomonas_salina.2
MSGLAVSAQSVTKSVDLQPSSRTSVFRRHASHLIYESIAHPSTTKKQLRSEAPTEQHMQNTRKRSDSWGASRTALRLEVESVGGIAEANSPSEPRSENSHASCHFEKGEGTTLRKRLGPGSNFGNENSPITQTTQNLPKTRPRSGHENLAATQSRVNRSKAQNVYRGVQSVTLGVSPTRAAPAGPPERRPFAAGALAPTPSPRAPCYNSKFWQ